MNGFSEIVFQIYETYTRSSAQNEVQKINFCLADV